MLLYRNLPENQLKLPRNLPEIAKEQVLEGCYTPPPTYTHPCRYVR
jgi:hypothetical protein